MIIYNKLDNHFFVSVDRQTFLGFEMTANLRDTGPLRPGIHIAVRQQPKLYPEVKGIKFVGGCESEL